MTSKGMRCNNLFPYIKLLILTIMAITNKEIINKQVERINEKMKTNFSLKESCDGYYLCVDKNGYIMPPNPLNNDLTIRSSDFMIEYLRGVEDAVDFFTHNGTK